MASPPVCSSCASAKTSPGTLYLIICMPGSGICWVIFRLRLAVNRESRVLPGPHLVDHVLSDPAFCEQEPEDLRLPDLEERRAGKVVGQRDERSVPGERTIGDQRVDVRVPVAELTVRLYARDHAGRNVVPIQHGAVDFQDCFPGKFRQLPQQVTIETKVKPEPFRHGEHEGAEGPTVLAVSPVLG